MKITVTFEIYVWFYSVYKWRKRKIQNMKSACISIELTVKPLRLLPPQDNCYTDGHIFKVCSKLSYATFTQLASISLKSCFSAKFPSFTTHHWITVYISDLANQLAEEYSLPIVTSYNSTRGFFLQLNCGPKSTYSKESLPGIFIKVTKAKNALCFTTSDLV